MELKKIQNNKRLPEAAGAIIQEKNIIITQRNLMLREGLLFDATRGVGGGAGWEWRGHYKCAPGFNNVQGADIVVSCCGEWHLQLWEKLYEVNHLRVLLTAGRWAHGLPGDWAKNTLGGSYAVELETHCLEKGVNYGKSYSSFTAQRPPREKC